MYKIENMLALFNIWLLYYYYHKYIINIS